MSRRKLNNINIDAIKIKGEDTRTPKGCDMFPSTYPNIAMIAKKKSGKTNLLYHILKNCIDKTTKIHLFVSTAKRDATWKDIINYLEKQGNKVDVHLGIFDSMMKGKRKKKVNMLEKLIDSWGLPDKKNGKGKRKKKNRMFGGEDPKVVDDRPQRLPNPFDRKITFSDLGENHIGNLLFSGMIGSTPKDETLEVVTQKEPDKFSDPKQKGKGGKLVPERLIIFDDLSDQLNDPQVARLLKANRHYKAMTFTSTQYVNDIPPTARSQFDYVIAFKGHTPGKVETIRKMCDSNVDEDTFFNMYKEATSQPYSFLYANCRDNSFRVNFDEELDPSEF